MNNPQDATWNAFELNEEEELSRLPIAVPLHYIYHKPTEQVEVVYTFPDSFAV